MDNKIPITNFETIDELREYQNRHIAALEKVNEEIGSKDFIPDMIAGAKENYAKGKNFSYSISFGYKYEFSEDKLILLRRYFRDDLDLLTNALEYFLKPTNPNYKVQVEEWKELRLSIGLHPLLVNISLNNKYIDP